MPDPHDTREGPLLHDLHQLRKLALRFHDLDAAVLDDRDAGRIVPAIFQTAQAVKQDRDGLPVPDIPHDAAHRCLPIAPHRIAPPIPPILGDGGQAQIGPSMICGDGIRQPQERLQRRAGGVTAAPLAANGWCLRPGRLLSPGSPPGFGSVLKTGPVSGNPMVASCVPNGPDIPATSNGRGVAFDPLDGNLWISRLTGR